MIPNEVDMRYLARQRVTRLRRNPRLGLHGRRHLESSVHGRGERPGHAGRLVDRNAAWTLSRHHGEDGGPPGSVLATTPLAALPCSTRLARSKRPGADPSPPTATSRRVWFGLGVLGPPGSPWKTR